MLKAWRWRIASEAGFEEFSEGMFRFEEVYGSWIVLYFQEQMLFGGLFEVPVQVHLDFSQELHEFRIGILVRTVRFLSK